ncbi:MAG TPA: DUF72 domain-containing protein [Steroidobacteraceae bacterium]|jgi:uncharacterized protein YecE (DUF72 family)
MSTPRSGHIRVGIGGWSYDPWRETFYPPEVPQKSELEYASRQVTAIEINSTFYRLQKPAVYAKWRDSTPDNFVFSIKAPRFIMQRKVLADAAPGIEKFIDSGIAELQTRLGPILWQLAPTQHFDAGDLERFLELLPATTGGLPLRHALEVRHESFLNAEFLAIARKHGVAVVFEDDAKYPGCSDLTSDFVYARLRQSVASVTTGYPHTALSAWAERARAWTKGAEPTDLPRVEPKVKAKPVARDVFIFFINGAKERAPAAACELISMLQE